MHYNSWHVHRYYSSGISQCVDRSKKARPPFFLFCLRSRSTTRVVTLSPDRRSPKRRAAVRRRRLGPPGPGGRRCLPARLPCAAAEDGWPDLPQWRTGAARYYLSSPRQAGRLEGTAVGAGLDRWNTSNPTAAAPARPVANCLGFVALISVVVVRVNDFY